MDDILSEITIILELCGIEINGDIERLLSFNLNKTRRSLLNYLNLKELPLELEYVLITRVIGEILKTLSSTGLLKSSNFKIEPLVTSMTRGDVSMGFKGLSREEQLNTLINSFETYGKNELKNFRVIKW